MTDAELIEKIVKEVLRRLADDADIGPDQNHRTSNSVSSKSLLPSGEKDRMRGPPSPQPSPVSGRGSRLKTPSNTDTMGKTLTLDESVVTLATVAGRLDEVNHIVLRNKAVITPSVRDELRDRNIDLVRSEQI